MKKLTEPKYAPYPMSLNAVAVKPRYKPLIFRVLSNCEATVNTEGLLVSEFCCRILMSSTGVVITLFRSLSPKPREVGEILTMSQFLLPHQQGSLESN